MVESSLVSNVEGQPSFHGAPLNSSLNRPFNMSSMAQSMVHSKEHTCLNAASGFHYHSQKADILPSELQTFLCSF